jgi:hypothetical protein
MSPSGFTLVCPFQPQLSQVPPSSHNVVRHVVQQIASSMVLVRLKWNQLPNVECFVRVIQINHNGTIDMLACHINQSVRSMSEFGKFTVSVLMDKEWVAHWIHVRNLARVFTEVVMIGDGLMSLADGLLMHHITCQHNHVTIKGNLSGCCLKSGKVGTVHCPLYRCK